MGQKLQFVASGAQGKVLDSKAVKDKSTFRLISTCLKYLITSAGFFTIPDSLAICIGVIVLIAVTGWSAGGVIMLVGSFSQLSLSRDQNCLCLRFNIFA